MANEKRFPDVEPATTPDGLEVDCPACAGPDGIPTGIIVHETWGQYSGGYSHIRQTCDLCWGCKKIGRAGLERWRARTGG